MIYYSFICSKLIEEALSLGFLAFCVNWNRLSSIVWVSQENRETVCWNRFHGVDFFSQQRFIVASFGKLALCLKKNRISSMETFGVWKTVKFPSGTRCRLLKAHRGFESHWRKPFWTSWHSVSFEIEFRRSVLWEFEQRSHSKVICYAICWACSTDSNVKC